MGNPEQKADEAFLRSVTVPEEERHLFTTARWAGVFAGSCRRTSSGSSVTLAGHHSRGVAQARWCHSGDGGCRRRAHQPGADSNADTLHVIAGRQRPPSPLAAYTACATRPSELAQGWRKSTPATSVRLHPRELRAPRHPFSEVGALLLKRHPDDFGPGVKVSQ